MSKLQQKSNTPSLTTEHFSITTTVEEGLLFLHIDLPKVNRKSLQAIRQGMDDFKEQCLGEGYDVVFATTSKKQTVKFWEFIEPCYKVEKLRDVGWLGSWLTEEI